MKQRVVREQTKHYAVSTEAIAGELQSPDLAPPSKKNKKNKKADVASWVADADDWGADDSDED